MTFQLTENLLKGYTNSMHCEARQTPQIDYWLSLEGICFTPCGSYLSQLKLFTNYTHSFPEASMFLCQKSGTNKD